MSGRAFGLMVLALALLGAKPNALVHLQGHLGLGNAYRLGAWVPLVIEARNDGPALRGTLYFATEGGGWGPPSTEHSRAVELPRHSRKRIEMMVRIDQVSTSPEVLFVPDRASRRVLELGRNEALKIPLKAQAVDSSDRFVGVLGPGGASIRKLSRLWDPDTFDAELVVKHFTGRGMPTSDLALRFLDDIVWLAPSEVELEPEQLEALVTWVKRGGHLVLAAGPDWSFLQAPPFEGLLPLTPRERVRYPGEASVEANDVGLAEQTWVVRGDLAPRAEIRAGSETWPLLTRRRLGIGTVELLSFHPERAPMAGQPLVDELWQRVIPPPQAKITRDSANRKRDRAYEPTADEAAIRQLGSVQLGGSLSQMATLAPVPLLWLSIILGCYLLCIGPIDYLVLKRLGKLQWTWVTFPSLIVLFTGLLWGMSHMNRSDRLLMSAVEVVDLSSGESEGVLRGQYALVSPVRTKLDLETHSRDMLLGPFSSQHFYGGGFGNAADQGMRARFVQAEVNELELPMRRWSLRYVETMGTLSLSHPMSAHLEGPADAAVLVLEGGPKLEGAEAVLIWGDEVWEFGLWNLPSDRHSIELADQEAESLWPWLAQQTRRPTGWRMARPSGDGAWQDSDPPPTWQIGSVVALSYVRLAEQASSNDPQSRYRVSSLQGLEAELALELESGPMLFLSAPAFEPEFQVRDFAPQTKGRRVFRIHVQPALDPPTPGAPT